MEIQSKSCVAEIALQNELDCLSTSDSSDSEKLLTRVSKKVKSKSKKKKDKKKKKKKHKLKKSKCKKHELTNEKKNDALQRDELSSLSKKAKLTDENRHIKRMRSRSKSVTPKKCRKGSLCNEEKVKSTGSFVQLSNGGTIEDSVISSHSDVASNLEVSNSTKLGINKLTNQRDVIKHDIPQSEIGTDCKESNLTSDCTELHNDKNRLLSSDKCELDCYKSEADIGFHGGEIESQKLEKSDNLETNSENTKSCLEFDSGLKSAPINKINENNETFCAEVEQKSSGTTRKRLRSQDSSCIALQSSRKHRSSRDRSNAEIITKDFVDIEQFQSTERKRPKLQDLSPRLTEMIALSNSENPHSDYKKHLSSDNSNRSKSRTRECLRSEGKETSQSKDKKRSRSKSLKRSLSRDRRPLKSRERNRSRTPKLKRSRDRNISKSKDRKISKPRESKRSMSRDRNRSRTQDRKRSKSKERKRSRSKDRKRSRSKDRIRSRSKDRKRSKSRDRKRSRSRNRKQSRSRNRKRSRSREKKRSRSRDKRRSRSRDKNRSSSRNRKRSRSRTKKRSPSWNTNRSISNDRKSRSRSRKKFRSQDKKSRLTDRQNNRKKSTSPTNRTKSLIRKHKISKKSRSRSVNKTCLSNSTSNDLQLKALIENIPASLNKNMFVEIGSYVKYDYVGFIDTSGDLNNMSFSATHYTQLAKYSAMRQILGEKILRKKQTRNYRYYQKKGLDFVVDNPITCFPLHENKSEHLTNKDFLPLDLTYAERLKASKQQLDKMMRTERNNDFYLNTVNLSSTAVDKPLTTNETEDEYWVKLSKRYNERLCKEPKNVHLWLEFIHFQDKAFVHLFRGSDNACSGGQGRSSVKSARAVAERKLALLDAAVKKNPHSISLLLERLTVGDEVWQQEQLNREWATLVYNFPNNMTVWHRYVRHHATSSRQFRVSSALSSASRCCEKLRLMAAGVFVTHAPPQQPGLACIDVTAQVCRLWAGSGYRERAVALWQALVEYNLFCPVELLSTQHDHKLLLLEQFWDSRAPRIGETSSVGWDASLSSKQTAQYREQILEGLFDEEDRLIEAAVSRYPILKEWSTTKRDKSTTPSDSDGETDEEKVRTERLRKQRENEQKAEYERHLTKLWLQMELVREARDWLPYAADPDDCEDPDRMVAFEVLAPFIVLLPMADPSLLQKTMPTITHTRAKKRWETDKQYEKFYLVLKFLEFLGVSVSEIEVYFFEFLGISNYEKHSYENINLEAFSDFIIEEDSLEMQTCLRSVKIPCSCVGPNLNNADSESYFQFVCNVIERVIPLFEAEYAGYLTVLYIKTIIQRYRALQNQWQSVKLGKFEKKYRKIVKTLLKKVELRNNLLVYREYGALEEAFVNFEEAERVYSTGLIMSTKGLDYFECDLSVFRKLSAICFSFINLHLTAATAVNSTDVHSNRILSLLSCLANEGSVTDLSVAPVSPACLIKARKKFEELLEIAILTFLKSKKQTTCNNPMITELCSYVALIQYFTNDFQSVCFVFENTITRIENITTNTVKQVSVNGEKVYGDASTDICPVTQQLLQMLNERLAWLVMLLPRILVKDRKIGSLVSPSKQRSIIKCGLVTAPDSLFLLAVYSKLQNWRDVFGGVGSSDSSVRQLVFRILPHLKAVNSFVSTDTDLTCVSAPRAVLSTLRAAVQRPHGRNSPLLWRLYLELSARLQPGAKTDALAYSALSGCPGNKAVYLSSVATTLHKHNTMRDVNTTLVGEGLSLRSILRLMDERGLRCRLPLQELELLLQEEHETVERRESSCVSEDESEAEAEDSEVEEIPIVAFVS